MLIDRNSLIVISVRDIVIALHFQNLSPRCLHFRFEVLFLSNVTTKLVPYELTFLFHASRYIRVYMYNGKFNVYIHLNSNVPCENSEI